MLNKADLQQILNSKAIRRHTARTQARKFRLLGVQINALAWEAEAERLEQEIAALRDELRGGSVQEMVSVFGPVQIQSGG